MTVELCRECGQPLSTQATACPHCGAPAAAVPAVAAPKTRQSWHVGRVLIVLGLLAWGGGTLIQHAAHKTGDSSNASSPFALPSDLPSEEPSPSSAPALTAADAAKHNDKGWVLEDFTARRDALGGVNLIARIKNANAGSGTGSFTVTVLSGSTPIAVWQGSALDVAPDSTVTVTMLTTDTVDTSLKWDSLAFQADASITG